MRVIELTIKEWVLLQATLHTQTRSIFISWSCTSSLSFKITSLLYWEFMIQYWSSICYFTPKLLLACFIKSLKKRIFSWHYSYASSVNFYFVLLIFLTSSLKSNLIMLGLISEFSLEFPSRPRFPSPHEYTSPVSVIARVNSSEHTISLTLISICLSSESRNEISFGFF